MPISNSPSAESAPLGAKKGRGGRRIGAGRKPGSKVQTARTKAEGRAKCAEDLRSHWLLEQFEAGRRGDRVAARAVIAVLRKADLLSLLTSGEPAGDLFAERVLDNDSKPSSTDDSFVETSE
jgi:hypothetical protein